MNLTLRVALTFIQRKNSKWPAFTSVFSVLGVAFGVAAFLVVVTIFNSFEAELRQLLSAANPNLIVFSFPNGIPETEKFMETLKSEIHYPFKTMSKFEYNEGVLTRKDRTAPVVMRAIEGEKSASGKDLVRVVKPKDALLSLNEGQASRSSKTKTDVWNIILGSGLALKLNADIGDEITFASAGFGIAGQNKFQKFKITGILSVGLAQYDERLALLNFDDGVALFGKKGRAKGIEVEFEDMKDALLTSKHLQKIPDKIPYSVKAIQEMDQGLFSQIERDGTTIKVIVLIITLVAAFNIIVTLSLGVVDRSRQIALLRSLGATRKLITQVFVVMGVILGSVGGILGICIGLVILKIFSGFEIGDLRSFYFLERIPVTIDPRLFLAAFFFALALAFVSALYPAYRATLISPLHGLKRGV